MLKKYCRVTFNWHDLENCPLKTYFLKDLLSLHFPCLALQFEPTNAHNCIGVITLVIAL